MGAKGLPRRYYNYPPEFEFLNKISTVGSYIIALGVLISFIFILASFKKGKKAGDNPWGASTLEWETTSPPFHENFEKEPVVTKGPYSYHG